MTKWPWITIVLTVLLAISPAGQAFLSGVVSSEALSRNIALPFLVVALVVAVVCGLLETWIRYRFAKRRP